MRLIFILLIVVAGACGEPTEDEKRVGENSDAPVYAQNDADGQKAPGVLDGADAADSSGGGSPVGGTDGDGTDGTDSDPLKPDPDANEPGLTCVPDVQECVGYDATRKCATDGITWLPTELCPVGQMCYGGQCSGVICVPDEKIQKCASPTAYLQCNNVGTHWVGKECPEGFKCFQGQCMQLECKPGSVICKGFSAILECKPDGSEWEIVEFCEKGGSCINGACVTACEVNLKAATYRGCEYYAVDLDNIEGGQKEPMALVVSVPSTVNDAAVTIFDTAKNKFLTAAELGAASLNVKAGSLSIFKLPPGNDIDGSGLTNKSYHITTSSPATVHQFNPLNGEGVYTNDASLLLPSKAGGLMYFVMSWPMRRDEFTTLRGFATIVASEPGETKVKIKPRSKIVAGPPGSAVKAANPGDLVEFTLANGDVLNIESDGEHGADLTGTMIKTDQRVVVFSGHECANIPLGITACDHIEQQLLPVEAWGNHYVADGFKKRSAAQFDVWRIMAGGTDVGISTNPPQKGYEKFKLQAGAFVTFPSSESFEIKGSGPFIVGHYMVGSNYPGHVKSCVNPDTGSESGIGDPALTLAVPMQQYLREYTVLTPPGYKQNFVNIIAPAGANITIDGQPLNMVLKQIGALQWGIARAKVATGVHTIKSLSKKKFGLTSYGYDCDVSYAYPGGLRLVALDVQKY